MQSSQKKVKFIEKRIKEILECLGYDLTDRNFKDTPARVARILVEELAPLPPARNLFSTFEEEHDQLVLLRNHHTSSRCPHHLERVFFKVSIGYIPNGKVLGLSKLARIADYFAHGLILQETYTDTLLDALWETLKPKGAAVMVVGEHQCMKCRGVKSRGDVVTHAFRGDVNFMEFLTLVGGV